MSGVSVPPERAHMCPLLIVKGACSKSIWEISLIIAPCVRRWNLCLIGLRPSRVSSWVFYTLVASYTSARPYVTDWGNASVSASWWMEAKMARQTITADSRWVAPVLILIDEFAQTGGKMDEEGLLIPHWETKLSTSIFILATIWVRRPAGTRPSLSFVLKAVALRHFPQCSRWAHLTCKHYFFLQQWPLLEWQWKHVANMGVQE